MTVKKRLWFWLGLALAVVPEILWSPVGNFLYEMSQTGNPGGTEPLRYSFLSDPANINILSSVLFLQTFGLLVATTAWFLASTKLSHRVVIGVLGYGMSIVLLTLFGLSVSLRSIGL